MKIIIHYDQENLKLLDENVVGIVKDSGTGKNILSKIATVHKIRPTCGK